MLPQQIARYEIQTELGRGGMAIVYKARDPLFEREVALKVLPAETLEDPQFRTRFVREAKTVAALEHPAVVPVYDFGEDGERLYLVMRLMLGGSLSQRLKQGPLPPEEAYRIMQRIAPALDMAHEKGIIHRDLKPDNILFDQFGEAYLSDFGIARLSSSQATLTGNFAIGTPGYMSPEQIQGQELDGRSDLYALGVILFEMLTGKRPFVADTPAMVLVKQMTDTAPRLSDHRPDTPSSLETVVQQALAQNRESRPGSANEIVRQFHEAVETKLSPIPPGTSPAKTAVSPAPHSPDIASEPTIVETPAQMRPLVAPSSQQPTRSWRWLGAIVGVIAILGVGYLIWNGQQDGGAAEPPAVVEEGGGGEETAVVAEEPEPTEETSSEAEHSIDDHISAGWQLFEEGEFERALEEANAAFEDDDSNADAYLLRGNIHVARNEPNLAVEDLTRVTELSPASFDAFFTLGEIYGQRWGDYTTAAEMFSRAIELDGNNEWAYANRCEAYGINGQLEEAEADCNRCLELNSENGSCHLSKGFIARDLGNLEEAEASFQKAAAIDNDPYTHMELAQLYLWYLGNLEAAIDEANQAIDLNGDDPYFVYVRGMSYHGNVQIDEALTDFENYLAAVSNDPENCSDCQAFARRVLEDERPLSADYLSNLAFRRNTTASVFAESYPPDLVVDGDLYSEWYTEQAAPQWIEIDLGEARQITAVELRVSQDPPGNTTHTIWGTTPEGETFELFTFSEYTEAEQHLYHQPEEPWENIQYIRIETVESPSFVAWYEIRVLGYGGNE